jgi:hypothetical protein
MYLPGLWQAALAVAILLSVTVRWLRSGAAWGAIDEGQATADILSEITGIRGREALMERFGPARLEDGIFPVTRAEVMRARTGMGYLMGNGWLDGACAVVALVSLFPVWPLWGTRMALDVGLMIGAGYQVAGWVAVAAGGRR